MAAPTRLDALVFAGKSAALQLRRAASDLRTRVRRFDQPDSSPSGTLLSESITELWTSAPGANTAEQQLTAGKIHNLRLAVRQLNRLSIPAGQTFSFWRHVGRATRFRGFVSGRELREGCVVPAVGGGICQLSNALHDAALRAGLEIVERHGHSIVVPGSLAEVNRDATVFWNYVDLRFRSSQNIRMEVRLDDTALIVRYWGATKPQLAATTGESTVQQSTTETGDCATCGENHCFRKSGLDTVATTFGRTAFLVDDYWPEYDEYIATYRDPNDLLFLPLDGQRLHRPGYRWTVAGFAQVHQSRSLTAIRALRSRGHAQGPLRQRVLLDGAAEIARSFGARLPYDVTHVVVMQHLLPALWESGYLGGRTFDVLMTAAPMRLLQQTLDDAHRLHPDSSTLTDFRADPRLLDIEDEALAQARHVVTPHTYLRKLMGERCIELPWARPPGRTTISNASAVSGNTILFPAATLARKGAYEVRDVARALDLRILAPGPDFEADDFWNGVAIERYADFGSALARTDAVILPAFVEHQPRALLVASAMGVPAIATPNCGLAGVDGIYEAPGGDQTALADLLMTVLSRERAKTIA